jgi:methionine sulfoxide reductase catalytic subunit
MVVYDARERPAMLIKKAADLPAAEITPHAMYLRRRDLLASVGGMMAAFVAPFAERTITAESAQLTITKRTSTTTDKPSSLQTVTTFNNFYEFGTDKADPAKNAVRFRPRPWSVAVEGLCAKPGVYTLEDMLKPHPLEERIYRHRCVEGWSIVVPWVGFPLADLLKRFEPTSRAQYVEFTTIVRPDEMNGQRSRLFSVLSWPYREGLRLDEAMHPLTLLVVGLYGQELPNQNGAPLRLIVPWKYGFKSIKSIVKIQFVEQAPVTSWMRQEPQFYGFYSNVNPGPTQSTYRDQSSERRLGEFFMRKTLPFNGYADQVAHLYANMDMRRSF